MAVEDGWKSSVDRVVLCPDCGRKYTDEDFGRMLAIRLQVEEDLKKSVSHYKYGMEFTLAKIILECQKNGLQDIVFECKLFEAFRIVRNPPQQLKKWLK